jgi:hypothetical protein
MKKLSIYARSKYTMVGLTEAVPYKSLEKNEIQIYLLKLVKFVKKTSKLALEKKRLFSMVLGQYTVYMISKLEELLSFTTINTQKNMLSLIIVMKNLIFVFNGEKEYRVSLVEADDKFCQLLQGRDVNNVQYYDSFNTMVSVV